MKQNHIDVHKDNYLLEYIGKMTKLDTEMIPFQLNPALVENEFGRTAKDIANDMINVYQENESYLKSAYPNNEVAELWIATNKFHSDRLRENHQEVDICTYCGSRETKRRNLLLAHAMPEGDAAVPACSKNYIVCFECKKSYNIPFSS